MKNTSIQQMKELKLPLERDLFLRTLIRQLAGTLEDVVGLEEAEGYISVVGQSVGEWINETYKGELDQSKLTRDQVIGVLIDLKERIQGEFYIRSEDENKIEFGNKQCPFGDKVHGRSSMCMMTSNVFGSVTAENLGYAKVELKETIARGNQECNVVVHFKRTDESDNANGREYFGLDD